MDYQKESLKLHGEWKGKIEVVSRVEVNTSEELALAYTPGVAAPCLEIEKDIEKSFEYTRRHNLCLVVTDGTAVLGLGDIGPEAGMPVMEGKCVLFKEFGGVDAFPLCVKSKDTDEIVRTISLISGSFGGINLEDIAAPRCFEIERKLKECCDIPVFHDDQHGTAIVVLAGLTNAFRLTGRKKETASVVICGAGAAGGAICMLLQKAGFENIVVCDKDGILERGKEYANPMQMKIAETTNPKNKKGTLKDALVGADVFIGVSAPNLLCAEDISKMAPNPIVFACANPNPEIMPQEALRGGAGIVATGRSDFPNQVNNVLVFPGIFRGALDVRAKDITDEMKLAAAEALANMVKAEDLAADYIIPKATDRSVGPVVAAAVAESARKCGVNRL